MFYSQDRQGLIGGCALQAFLKAMRVVHLGLKCFPERTEVPEFVQVVEK